MKTPEYRHVPVMLREVMELLRPRRGECWVDATLGGGGHSRKILEAVGPEGLLIGIDLDASALETAGERLREFRNFRPVQGNFGDLEGILERMGIPEINGILMDLGVSSHQLDTGKRGFSFMTSGPLDMRFDLRQSLRAQDLINEMAEEELAGMLREYGEERWAWKIARRIVKEREKKRIEDTVELSEIIASAVPPSGRKQRIHAAPVLEGAEPMRYPGEREDAIYRERSRTGIPLHPHVAGDLREMAAELGLDWEGIWEN